MDVHSNSVSEIYKFVDGSRGSVLPSSSESMRGRNLRGICPYGWKCPLPSINKAVKSIGLVLSRGTKPVFMNRKRCYICKGLIRREFRVFITVRLPPYITDPDLAVDRLREFIRRLMIHNRVRFVAVISVGKVIKVNGRYHIKYEKPHLHILAGAKYRVGWIRLKREEQVEALRKFIADVHRGYEAVLGPEHPGAIDIQWIRYPVKTKRRRRRKRRITDDDRARTVFKLRLYMFKQLVAPNGIYVQGMYVRRRHKLPSTDMDINNNISNIRADYALFELLTGGLGGYGGWASRRDGRRLWISNARRLLREVIEKGSFAGIHLGDGLSRKLVRRVLLDIVNRSTKDTDIERVLWLLYTYAVSREHAFGKVRKARECWEERKCSLGEVIRAFSRVLAIDYENILGTLLNLMDFEPGTVRKIFRSYVEGIESRILSAVSNDTGSLTVSLNTILVMYLRLQALSKKIVRKWLRDLKYIKELIDRDAWLAYRHFTRLCRDIAQTIESRYRYVKNFYERNGKRRKRRYKDRSVGRFVKRIRILLRQVKWFREVITDYESLDMLRFYDSHDLRDDLRMRLRNTSLCFFFAGHVVCIGVEEAKEVVAEVKEAVEEFAAYARYCVGLKVKAESPCTARIWLNRADRVWIDEEECREILCSEDIDSIIKRVDELIEKLSNLRRKLTARAKMRKRRYLARLRKLRYKLSKNRALDQYISGKNINAFERALNAFRAWLRRRRYCTLGSTLKQRCQHLRWRCLQ